MVTSSQSGDSFNWSQEWSLSFRLCVASCSLKFAFAFARRSSAANTSGSSVASKRESNCIAAIWLCPRSLMCTVIALPSSCCKRVQSEQSVGIWFVRSRRGTRGSYAVPVDGAISIAAIGGYEGFFKSSVPKWSVPWLRSRPCKTSLTRSSKPLGTKGL
jgi:hypothetical protein